MALNLDSRMRIGLEPFGIDFQDSSRSIRQPPTIKLEINIAEAVGKRDAFALTLMLS